MSKEKKKSAFISHGIAAQNRKARYDYKILSTIEAGIVLRGVEVKSLRLGRAQLTEAWAGERDGELYLFNMYAPPQHKLETSDKLHCLPYLSSEMAAMPDLRVALAIGTKAHESVLQGLNLKPSRYPFKHGAMHMLENGLILSDSFHTSQYNVNTGRITQEMFEEIVASIRHLLA